VANTQWNGSDKSANVTLSGLNLIAVASGASAWVRAVDKQITGKFYWECTPTVWGNANTGVGFSTPNVTTPVPTSIGTCVVIKSGVINVDGVSSGSTLGARAAADVISVAVDFGARLTWFRVAAAGNWNGSATANPATGAGGVAITSSGVGVPAFPLAIMGANLDAITANFGDTAFTGTVPSGFTSGFTAGASIGTNALATQAAVEHWLTTNPAAQVTQVALEHWASVQTTYPTPLTPSMMLSGSRAGIGSVVLVQDNTTRTEMVSDVGAVMQIAQIVPPVGGAQARAMILA
jgi:hypothetical protein